MTLLIRGELYPQPRTAQQSISWPVFGVRRLDGALVRRGLTRPPFTNGQSVPPQASYQPSSSSPQPIAPDAARLALLRLLLQRLRDEPVPRQPRLHRPGSELPSRHWLRSRLSPPTKRGRPRAPPSIRTSKQPANTCAHSRKLIQSASAFTAAPMAASLLHWHCALFTTVRRRRRHPRRPQLDGRACPIPTGKSLRKITSLSTQHSVPRRRRSQRPLSQTTDLVRRLKKADVPFEELVIPNDTHHFLRHALR